MKRLAVVQIIMLLMSTSAAGSTWIEQQTGNMHEMSGLFVNDDYGFSVKPPASAKAYVTNGGDGNHGLVVILGNQRAIYVYPQYAGLVDGDTLPCRAKQFAWESGSRRLNSSILINGVRRCNTEFVSGNVIRKVIQLCVISGDGDIMYSMVLYTNRKNIYNDNVDFVNLVKSFKYWNVA